MSDFTYLPPGELRFSLDDNGILSLDCGETHYDGVQLVRLFPFQNPEGMLSVSVQDGDARKELGIVRSLADCAPDQREALQNYLRYKYFIPNIEKIGKIEEKLGYVYMDITTVLGRKTICIADVTSNLRLVGVSAGAIIDVQGNRYAIEDIGKLSRENRQKIELYI